MDRNLSEDLINKMIDCSFPLHVIIFDVYCKGYENISTIQVSIFNLIYEYKRLNMSNLARILGYTNQRLTQPVDDLVRRGYLSREVEEDNRRMVFVQLTEKGQKYFKDSRRRAHEMVISLLDRVMNEDEKKTLLECLTPARELLARLNDIKI